MKAAFRVVNEEAARRAALEKRPLRLVKNRKPSGEVAAERAYKFALEIGADLGHGYGWIAYVGRRLGLTYSTAWALCTGKITCLGTRVVDQICNTTGVPVSAFMDPEVKS